MQMYQGSFPVPMMCFDVPHKMSISNLMHTINRSTFCIGLEAVVGGKCETRVLLFTWLVFNNCPQIWQTGEAQQQKCTQR